MLFQHFHCFIRFFADFIRHCYKACQFFINHNEDNRFSFIYEGFGGDINFLLCQKTRTYDLHFFIFNICFDAFPGDSIKVCSFRKINFFVFYLLHYTHCQGMFRFSFECPGKAQYLSVFECFDK